MLLTRECDYAIRILRALSGGGLVNVAEIAEKEDITTQITYKLARRLDKAGIIESHRGVNGGYQLAVPLNQLTMYDVFQAVDQKLLITECTGNHSSCSRNTKEQPCMVHKEFCRLQKLMVDELKSRSLLEVMNS
ncbi:MAG: Rrf2 family transcriptional regulator [Lachnospiraceae bacterium]|nr:Rrf2 family transcriptional regulator [Lachnospiraceae bacterium]MDD3617522.1 Rrf2 family transcriptional regulator [Lachnospiraceae bacterium]